MRKNLNIFLLLGVLILSSCQGLVDGLNDDPNNFTDTPLNLVLNHSLLNVVTVAEAEAARNATMFADQFTGVDRQYGTLNVYSTGAADYDATWEDIYQRGITQTQIAKGKAIAAGNTSVEGITSILEGFYFAEAAMLFGDIPQSQVNNVVDFPDPIYEDQVSVLNAAIALIDAGISKAGATPAGNNVFATSSTWAQVGNALKARYQLALKSYGPAASSAAAAAFTGDGSNWTIKHSSANYAENLFWQFEVEQRAGYLQVDSSYMHQMLDSNSPNYKGNSKTDEAGRKNFYTAADGVNLNTTNGFAAIAQGFPVISFSEVQLIAAESAARADNLDGALTALNAVRARNATAYGSQYDAYVLADFNAGGMLNTGGTAKDAMILEVLKEKYCSVIGLPTFADVNRTKNLIGVPIKGATASSIPQRFLYPLSEVSSNKNFPGIVDLFVPTKINQ